MNHTTTSHTTLRTFGTVIFTALACVALHYVRIPFPGTPVPLIVQPLGAFCAGALLGPWYGLLSQLIYLATLPFTAWAPLGGIAMLWGPTIGYMWGIVLSSAAVGIIAKRPRSYTHTTILLCLITVLCIHLPGMAVLRAWYGAHAQAIPTWHALIGQAILPFLYGDLAKAMAAAYLIRHTTP